METRPIRKSYIPLKFLFNFDVIFLTSFNFPGTQRSSPFGTPTSTPCTKGCAHTRSLLKNWGWSIELWFLRPIFLLQYKKYYPKREKGWKTQNWCWTWTWKNSRKTRSPPHILSLLLNYNGWNYLFSLTRFCFLSLKTTTLIYSEMHYLIYFWNKNSRLNRQWFLGC